MKEILLHAVTTEETDVVLFLNNFVSHLFGCTLDFGNFTLYTRTNNL